MKRIMLIGLASCFLILGVAKADIGGGPSSYLKKGGPDTMPYRIVLRHCVNAEDSMATLQVVEYTPERIVYRCVTP